MDIRIKKINSLIETIDKKKHFLDFCQWFFKTLDWEEEIEESLDHKESVYCLNATERAGNNLGYHSFGHYTFGKWILIPSFVGNFKSNLPLLLFFVDRISSLGFIFSTEKRDYDYYLSLNYGKNLLLEVKDNDLSYCLYYGLMYIYLNWNKMKFIENLET